MNIIREVKASSLSPEEREHLRKGCVAYNGIDPSYHYIPTLWVGIAFSVVFGLSFAVHVAQIAIKRRWWYTAFALGALGELIGWAARAVANHCPYNNKLFTLQISILIISPCFFSAGIYYILGELIKIWGSQYSLFKPKVYMMVFIGFDLLSIIVQGAGGGLASSAESKTPPGNTALGTHVMLAGIIVQLVSMTFFVINGAVTLYRARKLFWSSQLRTLIIATCLSTTAIMIRNYFRAVELGQGWRGYLITHEIYIGALDGLMMVIAVVVFNVFHPAWLLEAEERNIRLRSAHGNDTEESPERINMVVTSK